MAGPKDLAAAQLFHDWWIYFEHFINSAGSHFLLLGSFNRSFVRCPKSVKGLVTRPENGRWTINNLTFENLHLTFHWKANPSSISSGVFYSFSFGYWFVLPEHLCCLIHSVIHRTIHERTMTPWTALLVLHSCRVFEILFQQLFQCSKPNILQEFRIFRSKISQFNRLAGRLPKCSFVCQNEDLVFK